MRWALPMLGLMTATALIACPSEPPGAPPQIRGVTPRIAAAGETVTVRGTGFRPGLRLSLNGAALDPSSIGADTVEFTMPPGDIGESNLTLTNPDGSSDTSPGPARLGRDDEDVVRSSVFVSFEPGVTLETAQQLASGQGFRLESFTPPPVGALGACARTYAVYQDLSGRSTAQAINDLDAAVKRLDPRYEADPRSALTGSAAALGSSQGAARVSDQRFTSRVSNIAQPPGLDAIRVAVLDTGVSAHPMLIGLEPGRNFTDADNPADPRTLETDVSDLGLYQGEPMGHGTGVAALIGGQFVPSTPVPGPQPALSEARGLAAGVKLLPVKVCSSVGRRNLCLGSDVVRGICYAITQGAQVINLSLGGRQPMRALKNVLLEAARQNIVTVTAAGNRGLDNPQPTHYPAAYSLEIPGLIAVAATRDDGVTVRGAAFSSSGPWVSLAANADPIRTAVVTERGVTGFSEADLEGTSFAAPQVTAVAALLRAQHPDWTPAQIKARLQQTATPTPNCSRDKCGAGRLNPDAALGP